MHPAEKTSTLPLEAVFIGMFARAFICPVGGLPIAPSSPPHALRGVGIEQDGQVRLQISTQYAVQLQYSFAPELAPAALIRFGGIGKAITEHNLPVIERRPNDFCNVLRPRSKHQSHFCQGRKTLSRRVQQHASNLLARGRSARLTRLYDFMARRPQSFRNPPHLRALPGSG